MTRARLALTLLTVAALTWTVSARTRRFFPDKLFWAAGYHTAEYHIAQLKRADRDADGSYRVILSKTTPGRPVGRIAFHGTRADDPNDIVPHEHRRELRGYFVFAAWLNHVDAKGINSLSSLVTANGRSFIRHHLLDFGSALGSAAVGPREGWEGYETLVEQPGQIGYRALWYTFDNLADKATLVATTEETPESTPHASDAGLERLP